MTVRLPEDTSYDFSGIPVVNDATVEGTNFADADAQVAVTPIIPLELETAATKSFDPATVIASPGAAVTAHLGATNRSNATVETLVIQDPVDPAAAPHPFTFAGFTGFGAVTPPTGATGTAYEVFVVAPSTPTGWVWRTSIRSARRATRGRGTSSTAVSHRPRSRASSSS